MISWTNLLTRATVPAACFLLFLVPGKSENEYSRNWTRQKLLELCPRDNNKDVIIIILVHDKVYIPC